MKNTKKNTKKAPLFAASTKNKPLAVKTQIRAGEKVDKKTLVAQFPTDNDERG